MTTNLLPSGNSFHLCHWQVEGATSTFATLRIFCLSGLSGGPLVAINTFKPIKFSCFFTLANVIQTKTSAIDINSFTSDVAGFIASKKYYYVGNIFAVAKTSKWGS